jgi:hypothetical protein
MRIDTIAVDLGGVIATYEPAARSAAIGAATGLTVDDVEARLFASGLDARLERGDFTTTAEATTSLLDASSIFPGDLLSDKKCRLEEIDPADRPRSAQHDDLVWRRAGDVVDGNRSPGTAGGQQEGDHDENRRKCPHGAPSQR